MQQTGSVFAGNIAFKRVAMNLLTSGGLLLVAPMLLAIVEGAAKIPGDGCLRPPPELDQRSSLMVRGKRQVRINSTDPNLMTMTNLPYFSEIVDPMDPCYKYICYPMPRTSPFYAWVKRFNQDRCCRFEDQHISIGDFRTLDAGSEVDDGETMMGASTCSQKIVRCKLPEFPHDPPETVVEVLPNAKCCLHEGRMIPPGDMVLDAERCAMITCHEATAGVDFPGNKDLQISKVFDHSCGCCVFEGRMVKDGDWLVSNGRPLNITCMKGRLFQIEEMMYDNEVAKYNYDDDEDDDDEDGGSSLQGHRPATNAKGLLDFDLPVKGPLKAEDGVRCNQMCDPKKSLEPFLEKVRSLLGAFQIEKVGLVLEQHNRFLGLLAQSLMAAVSPGPASLRTYVTYYSHYCVHEAAARKSSRYGPIYKNAERPEANLNLNRDSSCSFAYSVDGLQGHPADCSLFNSWLKLMLMQDEPHEMQDWRLESIRMGFINAASNMHGNSSGGDANTLLVLFTDIPNLDSVEQLMEHLPQDQIQLLASHATVKNTMAVINVNDNRLLCGILTGGTSAEASTIVVQDKADIETFYDCILQCKCSQDKEEVFRNQMRTFKAYKGAVSVQRRVVAENLTTSVVVEQVSLNFRTAVFRGGVCPANKEEFMGKRRRISFANPEDLRHQDGALGPFREIGDVMAHHESKNPAPEAPTAKSGSSKLETRRLGGQGQGQGQGLDQLPPLMSLSNRDKMIGNSGRPQDWSEGSGSRADLASVDGQSSYRIQSGFASSNQFNQNQASRVAEGHNSFNGGLGSGYGGGFGGGFGSGFGSGDAAGEAPGSGTISLAQLAQAQMKSRQGLQQRPSAQYGQGGVMHFEASGWNSRDQVGGPKESYSATNYVNQGMMHESRPQRDSDLGSSGDGHLAEDAVDVDVDVEEKTRQEDGVNH